MFCNSLTFSADRDIPNLHGKVIMVTGGNAGLGLETVRQLAKHQPAHVYLAARSKTKGEAAIRQIRALDTSVAAPISFLHLDLSSFESVKAAAKAFQASESRLDLLINNAGIMMTAEGVTQDGYEIQFGTNHMGHALFTQLLLPTLQKTAAIPNADVRVVNLSSASESLAPSDLAPSDLAPSDLYPFDELKTTMGGRRTEARYCLSKIANIRYTSAIAQRHKDIEFIGVHPGDGGDKPAS